MKNYLNAISPKRATQREKMRADQVRNNAGGYVFAVSDETRFLRFLILGTEGGTFYASERAQTKLETSFVTKYARENGLRAVQLIVDVANENRAPKADPSLLALAAVAKLGDLEARKAAWNALPILARTGTHLLHFLAFAKEFGGWGRLTREGIANVYLGVPIEKLALWAVKYKARDGWTHADALRLAHPKTDDGLRNAVFKFMVDGVLEGASDDALRVIEGHLLALQAASDADAAHLMRAYGLPIEAVPTHLRGREVYEAALETNGVTWTLRNLGNLSRVGLLKLGAWDVIERVTKRLTNESALRKGRVHPVDVLKALLVYKAGRGVKGGGEWTAVPRVVDALEEAFYLAFGAVQPANKRFLLGIDVSGSMSCGTVAGVPGLTPNVAAAAMSMVTYRTERSSVAMGFTSTFADLALRPNDSLDVVTKKLQQHNFGATDCALPMLWATRNKVEADVFVVYTDNETWAGKVQPIMALREYRQKMGIGARLIVVGMTATRFSIADPTDAGMLDLVGFDTSAPRIMTEFAAGKL
ncbi:RNA-binding protein Rsr [Deinococcus yavapaiensis]|uniref:TROVE domain-containing protein n=1 Tax=Deinococcus yavapaiensis KR-236 TaxID=694435 RepID=A0A318S2H2_9DEIO|nr:RNA-binding protein Rsr [Deinococcus yavapaiensis]PYE49946.1 TROVE domain-containing protein [Deinococcus yavapaiensis KR-236]